MRRAVIAVALLGLFLAASAAAASAAGTAGQTELPTFEGPIVMTAPGQAPEYATVHITFQRAKIPVTSDSFMDANAVGDAKTMVIIIGGSGKGLGAAGIDLADEVDRAKRLLDVAKQRSIPIIGIHTGGEARRGANSQVFIELVAPECALLIVRSDGNADGIFTQIAQKGNLPLVLIEKTSELTDIFTSIFQ